MRVVLVSAYHSLEAEPINGVHDTEPAVEVPVLKEMPNVVNEVPAVAKEVPPPQEQVPAIATETPSPVKEIPGLREIPVPLNEAPAALTEAPSTRKDPSAIAIEHASNVTIEHAPAVTIESPPPLKESIAAFMESPPLEKTPPKEAVVLSDRGLFSVQNHQLSHVSFHHLVHHMPHFPKFSLIPERSVGLANMLLIQYSASQKPTSSSTESHRPPIRTQS